MKYSIGLEPVYEFSKQMVWLTVGLLVGGVLLFVLFNYLMRLDYDPSGALGKARNLGSKLFMSRNKARALREIDAIEAGLKSGRYDKRTACQALSMTLRKYVKRVTGMRADTYTAAEIDKVGSTPLTEIIRYIYEPEFAWESQRDAGVALERSRELIRSWK